jgi:hypothetical protein
MKMVVFWDVVPCSLLDVCRLSVVFAASIISEMSNRTSETLANFYQTTRRNNPEDSHLNLYLLFRSPGRNLNHGSPKY